MLTARAVARQPRKQTPLSVHDLEDARERFDRGAHARADPEAAGERDLDLPRGRQRHHHGDAALAAGLPADQTLEWRHGVALGDEHLEARRRLGYHAIERLDL